MDALTLKLKLATFRRYGRTIGNLRSPVRPEPQVRVSAPDIRAGWYTQHVKPSFLMTSTRSRITRIPLD